MKRVPLVLFLVSLWFTGCNKAGAGLTQFVGTWNATYTIANSAGVRVSSGTLTVKQPSSDTVTFAESSSVITGVGQFGVPINERKSFEVSLKEASAGSYLLNLNIDGQDVLKAFPLTYSDSGFKGQGSIMFEGKQQPVTASIRKEGQGSVWTITPDSDVKPKTLYEFTFKDKK